MPNSPIGDCLMCLRALALATVLSGAAAGEDRSFGKEPAKLRSTVDRLIAALDAESRSERASAQESLLELGPSILPLLPDDERIPNAAAREAIRRIRTQLERRRALATLAVSRVTLHGKFSLRDALSAVTSQTGNPFDVRSLDEAVLRSSISLKFNGRPFWSACDEILRVAGVTYAPASAQWGLKLIRAASRAPERELAVLDQGTVRVSIVSAALRSTRGRHPQRLLRINWRLIAEPRLRPIYARIAARDLEVRRPDSSLLRPVSPTAVLELSMGEAASFLRVESDFEVPHGDLRAIAFSGSLRIEMAAGAQAFVFDDLVAAHEMKRGGDVTVGLRGVEIRGRDNKSVDVEISVVYDQGGPAFESYRTWFYQNEARLETKSGRRFSPSPFISARRQSDGSVALGYNFSNVEGNVGDYRFVYVAPTVVTAMPVKFHFSDVSILPPADEGTRQ